MIAKLLAPSYSVVDVCHSRITSKLLCASLSPLFYQYDSLPDFSKKNFLIVSQAVCRQAGGQSQSRGRVGGQVLAERLDSR